MKMRILWLCCPFFAEYPYGVFIYAKRHVSGIDCMNEDELKAMGFAIRGVSGMMDELFGYSFPYMMCMHNPPVNMGDMESLWHFHIEFYSPVRSKTKLKYNASSETGAWAHCNPTAPEEKAEELRVAYARWLAGTEHKT